MLLQGCSHLIMEVETELAAGLVAEVDPATASELRS